MKRCVVALLGLLALWSTSMLDAAYARRGNPTSNASPQLQYFIVDSDDDLPTKPQSQWVDTLVNHFEWVRVTGFTNNDDGVATMTGTNGFTYRAGGDSYTMMTNAGVSTNGTIAFNQPGENATLNNAAYSWWKPANRLFPINNFIDTFLVLAPLWGDWEMRPTGDSSKVYYRVTSDTAYISFYNLALKGTEGQIRATFQIVIAKDSSITFQYRSFDGSMGGRTAEEIIQKSVTIGVGVTSAIASNYLHMNNYFAISDGSAIYAKDLHDGLAVRFIRIRTHSLSARSILFPSAEGVELLSSNFTFSGVMNNWADEEYMAYFEFKVKNLTTGITVTSKKDSVLSYAGFPMQYNGPTYQGLPCGAYQVTMEVTAPSLPPDSWTFDNKIVRKFYILSGQSFPFYESFNSGIPGCAWGNLNVEAFPARDIMYEPAAPRGGNDLAIVLDRLDINGRPYYERTMGDTIVSAPIDLAGKSNVYLTLSYQRGLKTDVTEAGILSSLRTGPEMAILNTLGQPVDSGDSLIIEGLLASGNRWNPATSSWTVLATLQGAIDTKTNKLRLKLPTNMISDHFRLRFRLKSRDHGSLLKLPKDDNDSWVIDAIEINSASSGQTEFEVVSSSLGNSSYTRVPRDVRFLTPTVTVANNGQNAGLGSFSVRSIITDQLGREVYHKSQGFAFPQSYGDTVIQMQPWDIKGSQGGVFTIKSYVENNFSEIYRANDTNVTTRALVIGDAYALDDNEPDTVGSLVRAPLEWFYGFVPFSSDSIRGVDLYFLEPQGATSWQLEFRRGSTLLGTRSFSVTPTERGWIRASFAPLALPNDAMRIHFTQTVGNGIGGDASKGLIFHRVADINPRFIPLFSQVVDSFSYAGNTQFYGGTATLDNKGVLIPMFRLVYSGSLTYLPVELIRFTGARRGEHVELNWRTASEENSRGFVIERQDGDNWLFVADVNARNSQLGATYFAEDKFTPRSELNYRLTEQDLDGSSRVIGHVKIGAEGASASELRVFPNPVVNTLSFTINGAMPENVVLMDALGREAKHAFGVTELGVTDVAAGTYFLHVEADGQTFVRSVVITK
jgi:hypothetical protein